MFFSILNNLKCPNWLFLAHLNIIMGLRPIYICNSFSTGIDFRRQNLTSVDDRF